MIWTLGSKTEAVASDLANFQREPGQTTVVPFFPQLQRSSLLALRVFRDAKDPKNNGGLEGERHAGAGTRSLSDRL